MNCLHPTSDHYVQESTGRVICRRCHNDDTQRLRQQAARTSPHTPTARFQGRFLQNLPQHRLRCSPKMFGVPVAGLQADMPGRGADIVRKMILAQAIQEGLNKDQTAAEIARELGVTERTVFRYQAKLRTAVLVR